MGKGIRGHWWQDVLLPALGPPTPDLQHSEMGAAMLSPTAISWPPASMLPWLPQCPWQPVFLVLFSPSPGPPGSQWRPWGRGGVAMTIALEASALL